MKGRLFGPWYAALALVLAGVSGCATRPPEPTLNPAAAREHGFSRKAWVGTVRIADLAQQLRGSFDDEFRAKLVDFVRESRNFCQVFSLPGPVQEKDLILDFRVDPFVQERRIHPAYVPGAILTLTLYTWLGGPIYVDRSTLGGELTVRNAKGQRLLTVHAARDEAEDVSLWSPRYAAPVGIEARTALIRDLLDRARERLDRLPDIRSGDAGCGKPAGDTGLLP